MISNMSVTREAGMAERPKEAGTPEEADEALNVDPRQLVLTVVQAIDAANHRKIERAAIGYDEDGGALVESIESDPNMRIVSIEQAAGADDKGNVVGSTRWVHIDAIHE